MIDLEDAVAPADKDAARGHTRRWLAAGNAAMVRINASGMPWHDDDLTLVAEYAVPAMLAKAEGAAEIDPIGGLAVPVVALVETAAGIRALSQICAVDAVQRLAFGSIDLANQLGVDPGNRDALLFHRSTLVLESAAAGLAPPIDGVTTVFVEPQAMADDFAYAKRLGMSAKLCIHPAQIAPVHATAVPTNDELAWARKVVESVGSGTSAAAVDGQMVDVPVVERARRILATAEQR